MDSNLKPVEGNLDTVVIENPSGSRMRQWNDVKLEDGNIFLINPKAYSELIQTSKMELFAK